jgi:hypothetical protein
MAIAHDYSLVTPPAGRDPHQLWPLSMPGAPAEPAMRLRAKAIMQARDAIEKLRIGMQGENDRRRGRSCPGEMLAVNSPAVWSASPEALLGGKDLAGLRMTASGPRWTALRPGHGSCFTVALWSGSPAAAAQTRAAHRPLRMPTPRLRLLRCGGRCHGDLVAMRSPTCADRLFVTRWNGKFSSAPTLRWRARRFPDVADCRVREGGGDFRCAAEASI